MHREHAYELARIRRPTGTSSKSLQDQTSTQAGSGGQASTTSHHTGNYPTAYNNNKSYQLHSTSTTGIYPAPGIPATTMQTPGRRAQNGGCNSKSHLKGVSKGAQERRWVSLLFFSPTSGFYFGTFLCHLNQGTRVATAPGAVSTIGAWNGTWIPTWNRLLALCASTRQPVPNVCRPTCSRYTTEGSVRDART